MTDIKSLRNKIINLRQAGIFHLVSRKFDSIDAYGIPAALDSFVTMLGFKAIENQWIEIDFSDARYIVVKILKKDLAYNITCMSEEEADKLIEEIFKTMKIGHETRFFTNGNFYEAPGNSWCPITNATFDTGVAIFNNQNIGLVWVEDED